MFLSNHYRQKSVYDSLWRPFAYTVRLHILYTNIHWFFNKFTYLITGVGWGGSSSWWSRLQFRGTVIDDIFRASHQPTDPSVQCHADWEAPGGVRAGTEKAVLLGFERLVRWLLSSVMMLCGWESNGLVSHCQCIAHSPRLLVVIVAGSCSSYCC